MPDTSKYIHSVFHGAYGVEPDDIPLCPVCDMPMWAGERIELQACDAGPGNPELLRLVHQACVNDEDEDD